MIAAVSFAVQTQKKTTVARVEGNVYEPVKVEPTDDRIKALKLPDGFRISRFAELSNPRMIAVSDDGTVYVTQREPGTLVMLRDTDKDGVADVQKVVAEKKMLHGLTINRNRIYLATVTEVFASDINPDGTLGQLRTLINDLPDGGQHPNRTLAMGPDGMLYISVGSTCNNCQETNEEHATILRTLPESGKRQVFSSGLRNTIGFGWHPVSKRMFGFDHGIDWLGDNEQEEEFNEITEGARYGWPFVYAKSKIHPHGTPPPGYTKEDWARMSKEPLLLYTPHSAPMQMAFYTGTKFPNEYRNNAFVAMRGSWNRKPPSGYEVVRVQFDQKGNPTRIDPFLTGFLIKGGSPDGEDAQFARLAGLAIARDGSLLLGDDANGVIYRVTYGEADKAQMKSRVISFMLPETESASTIKVSSADFSQNGSIPQKHSAYGEDLSPTLSWSGVPKGARSLVLMMEDPDAANPKPFVHWIVANIPPTATGLPASIPVKEKIDSLSGTVQGANNRSTLGYYGPRPPAGEPPHHYHFQVFALDTTLKLNSGFNRQALLNAMKGHVLAKGEVIGTYQRQ
jgi:Raf kinase inhibitor-like YbhB/YbcL family protein